MIFSSIYLPDNEEGDDSILEGCCSDLLEWLSVLYENRLSKGDFFIKVYYDALLGVVVEVNDTELLDEDNLHSSICKFLYKYDHSELSGKTVMVASYHRPRDSSVVIGKKTPTPS